MLQLKIDSRDTLAALANDARQIPFAISTGINNIAVGMQKHEYGVMASVIDRPTRYTLNSIFVARGSKANPTATVGLKDMTGRSSHYLEPMIKGNNRHKKGSEIAFGNRWMAPSKAAASLGLIDQYGNFKRSTIQQLLSYFSAAERSAGYTANSTNATRAKLAKIKRTYWDSKTGKMKTVTKRQLAKDSSKGYKTIGGKVYFISMGKGGNQHLAAGIWQKSGVHGVNVQPVLMQVSKPTYRKQFDFYGEAQKWFDKNATSIMSESIAKTLQNVR